MACLHGKELCVVFVVLLWSVVGCVVDFAPCPTSEPRWRCFRVVEHPVGALRHIYFMGGRSNGVLELSTLAQTMAAMVNRDDKYELHSRFMKCRTEKGTVAGR